MLLLCDFWQMREQVRKTMGSIKYILLPQTNWENVSLGPVFHAMCQLLLTLPRPNKCFRHRVRNGGWCLSCRLWRSSWCFLRSKTKYPSTSDNWWWKFFIAPWHRWDFDWLRKICTWSYSRCFYCAIRHEKRYKVKSLALLILFSFTWDSILTNSKLTQYVRLNNLPWS